MSKDRPPGMLPDLIVQPDPFPPKNWQPTPNYTEVQTMHLRFKRGRLQQMWLKRFVGYGDPAMPVEHVWKDVPYVDRDDAP